MEHRQITTNGISLHVVQDGPSTGPLVILLHGFPEFWYGWRRQIPYLANAGYRVWTPDQRGYNLSDKPEGIAAYTLDELAADVIGLMDAAGQEKAFVVGHDWGASVSWHLASKFPDRLERMVVMNAPHRRVMQEQLRRNFAQMRKSWRMLFFQLPWLPETLTRQWNWNTPTQTIKNSSRPGTFTKSDLDIYRESWSQPRAFTAMLNWFRAGLRNPPMPLANPRITVPTLLIWGTLDKFMGWEMAQPSIDLCDDGRLVYIKEATHWVQLEEADRVNELIDSFLSSDSRS